MDNLLIENLLRMKREEEASYGLLGNTRARNLHEAAVLISSAAKFASAAKQWKQATESRAKLLDSRGEARLLSPDEDLIEALAAYEEAVDGLS
jgi:hypothetical protein